MLKNIYTSTKTVSSLSAATLGFWMPKNDSMFVTKTTTTNEVVRLYRDGEKIHIGQISTASEVLRFDQAPEFGGAVINRGSTGLTYQVHPVTFGIDFQKPFTTGVPAATQGVGVHLRNRSGVLKYYKLFNRGYRRYDTITGTLEATIEVFPSGANLSIYPQWVKDQTIAFFKTTGEVALFDVDTEETLLTSFIAAPTFAVVDSTYQNIISVRASDKVVQVYDLQIEPNSFSSLSATPGDYDRYHKEALSITVLGSNSELVPNVPVIWTIVTEEPDGMGGWNVITTQGIVSPNISITDSLGVARTTYCPPGNEWITGMRETITARIYL